MSIYPDKRNGKPTGRWRVEVQRGCNTLKDRVDTYESAKKMERDFIRRLETMSPGEPKATRAAPQHTERLTDLINRAEQSLWAGKADAENSFKKLRFIAEVIGDQPIDTISTSKIDELVSTLREKGPKGKPLGDSTINRYLAALSKFLKWAIERGYRQTPMPKIEWCNEDEGRIRWITPEEEAKLYELLPDPYDTLVRVAIKTGMRKSEIYEAVEGEHAQVTSDHVHLWKTKNRKARSVPISQATHLDLMHLRDVGMPTERQLRYEWEKARKAMGLEEDEWFVFHCCRHTCATRMVRAGIDVLTIKKMLGHLSLQTTMRYAHVSDDDLRSAVNKVDALFA